MASARLVLDAATPVHHTDVEDGTWDADANMSRLPMPCTKAKAKQASCGYRDDMVDDDGMVPHGAIYLLHHFIDTDGSVGAASINGVNNAKARLDQVEGISESERATAEAHLNAHQDDYATEARASGHPGSRRGRNRMTDPDLSAKRAAAGRAGAARRWGTRASADAPSDDDLVCGTARELREMAEALNGNDNRTLTRARNVSASRVRAFKAEHPKVTNDQLAGRVWCEAVPDERPARRPRNRKLRVVNQDADVAEVWLYDYIDSWGGYWGISASEVVEQLAQITAPRIDVHINSGGGEVFEGIAIKRALASHGAEIYVCIDSLAASIASVIAMAGDVIAIDEAAFMMIHDASGFCYGQASDMLAMADLLDLISGTIAQTYASRTGKGDPSTWREAMLAETWYDAPKAIAAGLADRYLGVDDMDEPTNVAKPAFDGAAWLLGDLAATLRPLPAAPPAPVDPLFFLKETLS